MYKIGNKIIQKDDIHFKWKIFNWIMKAKLQFNRKK